MADNAVVDNVINQILTPILAVMEWLVNILFSSRTMVIFLFFVVINIIAVVLMKKDKAYAEKGERRIRELTLLIVALVGGSFGMYFAMFKYKHKTLHKKFSVGIPIIIVMQCAYVTYMVMRSILI